MVKQEKLSNQKEFYRRAEISVIYFPAEDIVTASPASTTLAENFDKGKGTSNKADDFYWWE